MPKQLYSHRKHHRWTQHAWQGHGLEAVAGAAVAGEGPCLPTIRTSGPPPVDRAYNPHFPPEVEVGQHEWQKRGLDDQEMWLGCYATVWLVACRCCNEWRLGPCSGGAGTDFYLVYTCGVGCADNKTLSEPTTVSYRTCKWEILTASPCRAMPQITDFLNTTTYWTYTILFFLLLAIHQPGYWACDDLLLQGPQRFPSHSHLRFEGLSL